MQKQPISTYILFIAILVCLFLTITSCQTYAENNKETQSDVWDLRALYSDDSEWEKTYNLLLDKVKNIQEVASHQSISAKQLMSMLQTYEVLKQSIDHLQTYAFLRYNTNYNSKIANDQLNRSDALLNHLRQKTAFIRPTLMNLDPSQFNQLVQEQPELSQYRSYFSKIRKQSNHQLGEEGETVLANAKDLVWNTFLNYDVYRKGISDWQTIELSNGKKVKIDQAAFSQYAQSDLASERKMAHKAYWSVFGAHAPMINQLLLSRAQAHLFEAKSLGYSSVLQWSSEKSEVPELVPLTLIKKVNENLDLLHEYFSLKAELYGINKLDYADLGKRIPNVDHNYSLEESKEITRKVLKPLGSDYLSILNKGFSEQWMHPFPSESKEEGAFVVWSAYKSHPFVFLNHRDDFKSLETFVHEWGHAVHIELAKNKTHYLDHEPTTYVTELASNLNEVLLFDHMIANSKSKEEKLDFILQALDKMYYSIFVQTMVTEFENFFYSSVEQGNYVDSEILHSKYLELMRTYYGHNKGVVNIESEYGYRWAWSVQMFYRSFYVYQYATSLISASAMAERLIVAPQKTQQVFIDLLSQGGSLPSHDMLKQAGIDLTSEQIYSDAFQRMRRLLQSAKELLSDK